MEKRKIIILLALLIFICGVFFGSAKAIGYKYYGEKLVNNFIILFDSSQSMERCYTPEQISKYDKARKVLAEKVKTIPELGFNSGLYSFTPFEGIYSMANYQKDKFFYSTDYLPRKPGNITNLTQALREIEKIIAKLSGRTIVYFFSDGTYTDFGGSKGPVDITKELTRNYDVCFNIISVSPDGISSLLTDMAKQNTCSSVTTLENFSSIKAPFGDSLYKVIKVAEGSSYKAASYSYQSKMGPSFPSVLFDLNKDHYRREYTRELDKLGAILRKYPNKYVLLEGHADDTGTAAYNVDLSRRRIVDVYNYLMRVHQVERTQILTVYYGDKRPIASNYSESGRAKNRRVEITVGW